MWNQIGLDRFSLGRQHTFGFLINNMLLLFLPLLEIILFFCETKPHFGLFLSLDTLQLKAMIAPSTSVSSALTASCQSDVIVQATPGAGSQFPSLITS